VPVNFELGVSKYKTYKYFHETVGLANMPRYKAQYAIRTWVPVLIIIGDIVMVYAKYDKDKDEYDECLCKYCVVKVRGDHVLIRDTYGRLSWKNEREIMIQSRASPENRQQTKHFESWTNAVMHNEGNQSASDTKRIADKNLLVHYVCKDDIVELEEHANMCKYCVVKVTGDGVLIRDADGRLSWKNETELMVLSRGSPQHFKDKEHFESWTNAVIDNSDNQSASETMKITVGNLFVRAKASSYNRLQSMSAFCGRRRVHKTTIFDLL